MFFLLPIALLYIMCPPVTISVTQGLAIRPDAVRVGLVEFSGWRKRPRHRTFFHLPQHKSQEAVLKAIRKTPYMRGSTRTGAALQYTLGDVFARAPRSGVPRILVLITDGKSQDHVSGPGKHLRNSGIEIFTIGVGKFNRHQLEEIASNPKNTHILTVNNVGALKSIGETLLKSVCSAAQEKPKPQPIPLPRPPPLQPAPEPKPENELELELIFLIDGTIPQSQFAYIIKFLNAIVGRLSLGNDYTRIAIVVIGTETSYAVPFSGSRTELVSSFLKLHAVSGSRNLGLALKYVASNLLNKARPNAAKFIVTILGGPPADDFSIGLADVESMGGSVIALGAGLDAQILEQIASSHSLFVSWTSLSSLVSYSSSFITLVYEPIIVETNPSTTNMDLVFLVDGSNGVSDTDFVEIRRFLSNSVSSIDVRPDRHRLAIVQIGGQPHTDLFLDSTGGKKAALAAISKMSRTKGARNVGQALTYVLTNVLNTQHGARPYTGKMVVMVVGGATADDVTGPVKELRNLGISVLIVGVAYSDTTALEAIASSPDFVSTYNSFGMLESFSLTTGMLKRRLNNEPYMRANLICVCSINF
uniref:VWFA domain-containing protein n=1 Tax=Eptatretus burgeri TaxID=7764 RepID=A0A8C4QSA3_EPTBU